MKIRNLFFLILAGCCGPAALGPPPPDPLNIPEARSEREVILYANLDKELLEEIGRAFEETYGVRVIAFSRSDEEVMERLRGKLPDVLHLSDPAPFFELKREGRLRPRRHPTSSKVPAWLKDAEDFWIAPRATAAFLIHQKGKAVPKSWRELEKLKGRLVLPDPGASSAAFHWSIAAANLYGWDFLRGLARNQLLIVKEVPQALALVSKGEREAALGVGGDEAWRAFRRGEPISLARPEEGVPVVPAPAALLKGGPHPKAGDLLLEFLLSERVQKLFAREGMYPSRVDIPPPEGLPALGELNLLQPNFELVARKRAELWRELREALNLPPSATAPSVEMPREAFDVTALRKTPCSRLHPGVKS